MLSAQELFYGEVEPVWIAGNAASQIIHHKKTFARDQNDCDDGYERSHQFESSQHHADRRAYGKMPNQQTSSERFGAQLKPVGAHPHIQQFSSKNNGRNRNAGPTHQKSLNIYNKENRKSHQRTANATPAQESDDRYTPTANFRPPQDAPFSEHQFNQYGEQTNSEMGANRTSSSAGHGSQIGSHFTNHATEDQSHQDRRQVVSQKDNHKYNSATYGSQSGPQFIEEDIYDQHQKSSRSEDYSRDRLQTQAAYNLPDDSADSGYQQKGKAVRFASKKNNQEGDNRDFEQSKKTSESWQEGNDIANTSAQPYGGWNSYHGLHGNHQLQQDAHFSSLQPKESLCGRTQYGRNERGIGSNSTGQSSHGDAFIASQKAPQQHGHQFRRQEIYDKYVQLEVPICCESCEERVYDTLLKLKGVKSVDCDIRKQKVVVFGSAPPAGILNACRKMFKKSEMWTDKFNNY